jgi:ketosteroid isomerase-like protein
MSANAAPDSAGVIDRLVDATNRHDLDALADCFHPNYDSLFPAHPGRAFRGQKQMRDNWSRIFLSVPDIRSTLVRTARDQQTVWAEWEWTGTRNDGQAFLMRGVTIQEIREGKVAWVRLYMEPVDQAESGNQPALDTLLNGPSSL